MPRPYSDYGRRKVLNDVITALFSHQHEIHRIPIEQQDPFVLSGLKKGDDSKQNLKKLLLFNIQARGGPRLSLERVNKALSEFDECYDIIAKDLIPNFDGQKTVDQIYEQLTNVDDIGPKIAGVFLRDLGGKLDVWKETLPYLYLPIDRHIRALLVERLQVFSDKEVPNISESFFTRRNQSFQKELAEIHTPRVDFDDLWFIGSQFCSFRKLCPVCWIREFCRKRFEVNVVLNL